MLVSKPNSDWEHPFHNTRCLLVGSFNSSQPPVSNWGTTYTAGTVSSRDGIFLVFQGLDLLKKKLGNRF